MAIMDYAGLHRRAEQHQDWELIQNLYNLVSGKPLTWPHKTEEQFKILMTNIVVRLGMPLFGKAKDGFDNKLSVLKEFAEFFVTHVGAEEGPYLVKAMEAYLSAYIEKCREAGKVLPFEFEPAEQKARVASLLEALAKKMEGGYPALPIWPPPRTGHCF